MIALSPACGATGPVVKSVARTLEVLEFFAEIKGSAKTVMVAEALGYPVSSAAALLKSMAAMGYLQCDRAGRRYWPTDRVALLGSWISPQLFGVGPLHILMRRITETTGKMAIVGARNGDFVQYILIHDPNRINPQPVRPGTMRKLHLSGLGHSLLSSMPDDEIRPFLKRMNAYRGPEEAPLFIDGILTMLAEGKRREYFVSTDHVISGFGVISIGLPMPCMERPLAIGLGAATNDISSRLEDYLSIMRREISDHFDLRASLDS